MKEKPRWTKTTKIIGIIIFIAGTIDPLEGSVLILAGSFLFALSAYFSGDTYFKAFLTTFLSIGIGVIFLFYLSSLGGFDDQHLSWRWSILILPYPVGWLLNIILLIKNARKRSKSIEGNNVDSSSPINKI